MQGAESSQQRNKNELIPGLLKKTKTSGSRNHYRRISHLEQRVRINQPRPSAREREVARPSFEQAVALATRSSSSKAIQPLLCLPPQESSWPLRVGATDPRVRR